MSGLRERCVIPVSISGRLAEQNRQLARASGNFLVLRLNRNGRYQFQGYSSVTSIAISGQLLWASHALSSSPAGTEPSPTSWALPNSSRSNNSGASDLQRACPWHLSWSTRIFSFPDMAGVPLCRAGGARLVLADDYSGAGGVRQRPNLRLTS